MKPSVRALLLLAVTAAVPLLVGVALAQPAEEGQGAVVTLPGQTLPSSAVPAGSQSRSGPQPTIEVPPLPGPGPQAGPGAPAHARVGPEAFAVEDAPPDLPGPGTGAEPAPSGWDEQVGATIVWDTLPAGSEAAGGGAAIASGPARRIPQLSGDSDGASVAGSGTAATAEQALIAREPRRERPVDPARRGELAALSRVLGQLHALRVSCAGRDDQTWRSRMATLLDLEAPASGALREPLVAAFNAGFQTGGRGTATCPVNYRAAEARLAREGRSLALALAARSRGASAVAPGPGGAPAGPASRTKTASQSKNLP